MEPYAPGSNPGFSPVREGLNLASDLGLLPLPFAMWLHDSERNTAGGYRAVGIGAAGVLAWLIADLFSGLGLRSGSALLGAVASGLLAVWIVLACRRGVATGAMPRVLGGLGMWAAPGLLLMAGVLAQQATLADGPRAMEGPPPVASVLVFYVLVLGPFWVWLVMAGSYLLSYPGTAQAPKPTP
jgi:hypothetical protein